MVDEKDLEREKERAGDDEQVSFGDAEAFVHAQQIKPYDGDDDTDPDEKRATFFQEDAEDRHENDVAGRDETRLADSRVFDADLLHGAGRTERDSTAQSADQQVFATVTLFYLFLLPRLDAIKKWNDGDEDEPAENGTEHIKGKRPNGIHRGTLGAKRKAPDDGRQ